MKMINTEKVRAKVVGIMIKKINTEKVVNMIDPIGMIDRGKTNIEKTNTGKTNTGKTDPEKINTEKINTGMIDIGRIGTEKIDTAKIGTEMIVTVMNTVMGIGMTDTETIDTAMIGIEKTVTERIDIATIAETTDIVMSVIIEFLEGIDQDRRLDRPEGMLDGTIIMSHTTKTENLKQKSGNEVKVPNVNIEVLLHQALAVPALAIPTATHLAAPALATILTVPAVLVTTRV